MNTNSHFYFFPFLHSSWLLLVLLFCWYKFQNLYMSIVWQIKLGYFKVIMARSWPSCKFTKILALILFTKINNLKYNNFYNNNFSYEPRHDKTNILRLRPAWVQTRVRLRAVWSGSMLFAFSFSTCKRVCRRTGMRTRRLVWIHASRKRTMLVLSWRGSYLGYIIMFSKNISVFYWITGIMFTLTTVRFFERATTKISGDV
jgi:hypothetical protein